MERLRVKHIFVNVEFNNIYASRVGLLYLFYRLRIYAMSRGGSIKGFNFSKSERYNVLPKLIKEGLVTESQVISYRKLCTQKQCKGVFTTMSFDDTINMDVFRGFVLATSESYILERNYRRQNNKAKKYSSSGGYQKIDWVKSGVSSWHKVKKITSGDNAGNLMGRVFAKQLSDILELSERSLSRWRKHAPNIYRYNTYTPDKVPVPGRDREKYSMTKSGQLITADLYIISKLDLFTTSCYDGNTFKHKKTAGKTNVKKSQNYIITNKSTLYSSEGLSSLLAK